MLNKFHDKPYLRLSKITNKLQLNIINATSASHPCSWIPIYSFSKMVHDLRMLLDRGDLSSAPHLHWKHQPCTITSSFTPSTATTLVHCFISAQPEQILLCSLPYSGVLTHVACFIWRISKFGHVPNYILYIDTTLVSCLPMHRVPCVATLAGPCSSLPVVRASVNV